MNATSKLNVVPETESNIRLYCLYLKGLLGGVLLVYSQIYSLFEMLRDSPYLDRQICAYKKPDFRRVKLFEAGHHMN